MISNNSVSICVPIVTKNLKDLEKTIQKVLKTDVSLIEFRRDYLQNGDQEDIIYTFLNDIIDKVEIIFTFRAFEEGGQTFINDEERFKSISKALRIGCVSYLDIEEKSARKFLETIKPEYLENVKLIISAHNFKSTPKAEEILRQLERNDQYGDILKVAYKINSPQDLENLKRAAREFKIKSDKPLVIIGMGELGTETRIFPEKISSNLTFAPLDENTSSAPGQLNYKKLLNYRKSL